MESAKLAHAPLAPIGAASAAGGIKCNKGSSAEGRILNN